jgi:hypothetical protein
VSPTGTAPAESAGPLLAADDASIELGNSQTLTLSFSPPAASEDGTRSYFVSLRARYALAATGAARSQAVLDELPTRFALSSGQPNPFARSLLMRLDVPRRSQVRVEAFDVLGRRVRTLAHGEFAPGTHALIWDGADDDGTVVKPGVYMVRAVADGFISQRRVVRLAH